MNTQPRWKFGMHLFVALIFAASTLIFSPPAVDAGSSLGASLQLVSQTHFVPGEEGSLFRLSLTVDRSRAAPVQVPSFLVINSHRAVDSRKEVREAINGDVPRVVDTLRIDLTDRVSVEGGLLDVLIGSEVTTRTRDLLQLPESGLYPLTVSWEEDGVITSTFTTFLERLPTGSFSPQGNDGLRLALIGNIDSAITLQSNSTTTINDLDRQKIIDVLSLVETLPDTPITLSIRPELIEALDRSSVEDSGLLGRLQASSSLRVLSKTFVDVDPNKSALPDRSSTFRRQLRLGEDVLTTLLPTHINPRLAWLQNRPLTDEGGILLAELGIRNIVLGIDGQQDTTDGAAFFADTTRKIELRLSDDSTVSAALVDPYLSDVLSLGSQSGTSGPVLLAHHIVAELKALLVELDQSNDSLAGRGVLLSTNDGSLPNIDLVTALLRILFEDPRFSVVSAETLLSTMSVNLVDGRSVVIDLPSNQALPDPSTTTELTSLTATVDAFSSMLPQGDLRPRRWRRLLDVLPHEAFSDEIRAEYATIISDETSALAQAIVPPMATTFTLGGRDSPIRFSVGNDGDTDARVRIRLTSSKLSLPDGEKVVLVPARSSMAVDIPVIARSNGRFPVTLQMFTPEGNIALGPTSTLTARVNALAGLGQLVTGVALLLLLSWWASHLRRQHHHRRSEEARLSQRHPSGSI